MLINDDKMEFKLPKGMKRSAKAIARRSKTNSSAWLRNLVREAIDADKRAKAA